MYFTPNDNIKICTDSEYPSLIKEITTTLESLCPAMYLDCPDSIRLCYRRFLVENAKGAIVIIHGYTEFYQKYYETIWYLINSGYNVYIYDQRGHGMSTREVQDKHLAHIGSFDDYVNDLSVFIHDIVMRDSSDLPISFFAHSMGGAIALLYMAQNPGTICKALLCSPMIAPATHGVPSSYLRRYVERHGHTDGWNTIFNYAGKWDPNPDFSSSCDLSYNRFLSNLDIRRSDWHYQNSSSTNAWIHEALNLQSRLLNQDLISQIDAELLILTADHDRIVKMPLARKFARMANCEFRCFKNSKHTLFTGNDEITSMFFSQMLTFFNQKNT